MSGLGILSVIEMFRQQLCRLKTPLNLLDDYAKSGRKDFLKLAMQTHQEVLDTIGSRLPEDVVERRASLNLGGLIHFRIRVASRITSTQNNMNTIAANCGC